MTAGTRRLDGLEHAQLPEQGLNAWMQRFAGPRAGKGRALDKHNRSAVNGCEKPTLNGGVNQRY
ncbi:MULTISPECIES: hypothetical protein, partial [Paraburkholderia]|uniref:hypothetical protein n=1 Tax=Paraburkholderia TaxID=1822464 RepID=UPI002258963C